MNYIDIYEDALEYTRSRQQPEVRHKPKHSFYHPTNTPDTFIKNAVTGVLYPWKTGTLDARRLFKMVDTTGYYDADGVKMRPTSEHYPNPNPNQCYYDSPLQYMTHTRHVLNPEFIEQWNEQQIEITYQDNSM